MAILADVKEKNKKIQDLKKAVHKDKTFANDDYGTVFYDFMALFYEGTPFDDIRNWDDDRMIGVAKSLFDGGEARKKDDFKIRVINPTKAKHGFDLNHTVIEVVSKNVPFIVDSLTSALNRLNYQIHLINHPMMVVERDRSGKAKGFSEYNIDSKRSESESFVHIQLSRQMAPSTLKTLESTLHDILKAVMQATNDWRPMLRKINDIKDELIEHQSKQSNKQDVPHEWDEYIEFLTYLHDNHFTFLGYREYSFQAKNKTVAAKGSGLGILQDDDYVIFEGYQDSESLPPEIIKFRQNISPIAVRKSTKRAVIHRNVNMDVIFIKKYDKKGAVIGEHAFIGLFTSTVYSQSVLEVPFAREKARKVLHTSKFQPATHDYKALVDILEKYPRDEVFQASIENLFETSVRILELKERNRVAVFFRRDVFERFVTVQVYVPRDKYGTEMRHKIQNLLESEIGGVCEDFFTTISDSPLARVIFIIRARTGTIGDYDPQKLEEKITEISRSWRDHLRIALIDHFGQDAGAELAKKYKGAFSGAYEATTPYKSAVADIGKMEQINDDTKTLIEIYKRKSSEKLAVKLYNLKNPVVLSDILPVLENMGFRVITEEPYHVKVGEETHEHIWIHDIHIECKTDCLPLLDDVKDDFEEAFLKVWAKKTSDDKLNSLVINAGLDWSEIKCVRTYARYLRQAVPAFSRLFIKETLCNYAHITRKLIDYFQTRHNPKFEGDRDKVCKKIMDAIHDDLRYVQTLNEDRVLRHMIALFENTLRTNYYQKDKDGQPKDYISVKLNSEKLDFLPLPRPFREIYVFSEDIEGVHLRGGRIARGGLRWSDRFEDYRTEVLGLMKAQMVKNAVIVPVGSKGGFVVKTDTSKMDRQQFIEEGQRCYKIFISGLLDITDNLDGAKVIPPKNVVRYDGDDPYLVVAADKGTATFSDIANAKSADYGFWLGDAFASGGSAGYDHKKMGITAKGAWESVKRHFREMGKNIQKEDFTVIGVGDMSGDVFGNGMLLSRHIKLLGAFNHMHIFCDPNPDPETSFEERERLFNMPRSAWTDYSEKVLSKGGRVFNRTDKSVELTPEIQAAFGIKKKSMTPDELIRIMLKTNVELLWFGGIGTYVKASDESHSDVGDRANDALRINGAEINAKVIGEGANLGVTQKARIEYTLKGGRANADFVDNSGGVDCSDHEVNIKILLFDVMRQTKMDIKSRNKLLDKMQDEVSNLVIRNNYQQTQAISLSESKAATYIETHLSLIRQLEKTGLLNRSVEFLPSDEEIQDRIQEKRGLTRPELAILTSYSKIRLYNKLLDGDLLNSQAMNESWLNTYFPTQIQKKYEDYIDDHKLRKQIIATDLSNSLVNRMGFAFTQMMEDKTGATTDKIAKAYVIAKDVCNLNDFWADVEALDNVVSASVQYEMLIDVTRFADRIMNWFIIHGLADEASDIKGVIKDYKPGFDKIRNEFLPQMSGEMKKLAQKREKQLLKQGVPQETAEKFSWMSALVSVCEIIRLARDNNKDPLIVARIYYGVGSRLSMDWLRDEAKKLKADEYWQSIAVNGIIDDLYKAQAALAGKLMSDVNGHLKKNCDEKAIIEDWLKTHYGLTTQFDEHLKTMRREHQTTLPFLSIADQKIRMLSSV